MPHSPEPPTSPTPVVALAKKPDASSAAAVGLDPQDATVLARRYLDLIIALLAIVLATGVFLPFLYVRPQGVLAYCAFALAVVGFARWLCVHGRPGSAMFVFASFQWLAMTVLSAFAGKPMVYAVSVVGLAPLLALVIGLRAAALFAGSFVALSSTFLILRANEVVFLPVVFPVVPLVEITFTAIALITVLYPLPTLMRAVNGSLSRMRDSLQQRDEAQRRLLDFASVGDAGFWETDAEHRVTDFWGGDASQVDITRKHMLGRRSWEISPAEDEEQAKDWDLHRRSKIQAREAYQNFDYPYLHADGKRYWISVSGKPFYDAQGKFMGYRGKATHIGWRKAKEAELKRAKQDAEQANRAKSDFLATMSHEIRTPMNGIMGMTTLALEEAASDRQREYLTVVQDSAQSLLAIINDILDLSKIEAGRMELEIVPLEVRSLVNGALKTLSFTAYNKGVELAAEVADDVPAWVAGDPTRLRQVLLNLTSNAVKFTPKQGSVTLRVHCVRTDGMGMVLRFAVQDTGIGVAEDKLETIFQPFSQADSSTTRQYGGTGLGLTICRRLVQMMGGQIGVHSTVGVGSTFHFTARLEPAEAPKEQQTAVEAKKRSLKVLLAEDHPINQMLAVTLLERAGHQVTVAANGQEAVEQWRADRPDVILMDVQMPILDGLAATQRIREAEAAQNFERTPIIAMTANAFAEDRQACIAAGMDAYLTKPAKPEVLYATLGEVTLPH